MRLQKPMLLGSMVTTRGRASSVRPSLRHVQIVGDPGKPLVLVVARLSSLAGRSLAQRLAFRQPAATASASVQNQRSPAASLITVSS